jgi:hypothetical protein
VRTVDYRYHRAIVIVSSLKKSRYTFLWVTDRQIETRVDSSKVESTFIHFESVRQSVPGAWSKKNEEGGGGSKGGAN